MYLRENDKLVLRRLLHVQDKARTSVHYLTNHGSFAATAVVSLYTEPTTQVMSGGESGMGACLHEVETLAFLKVKRQEAGITQERSRFAELASWFYKRSAVGGVDHVCLVFRGGGLSLREAMSARSPPPLSAGGVALGSSGRPGAPPPSLVWEAREMVEVARGLLEVRPSERIRGFTAVSVWFPSCLCV